MTLKQQEELDRYNAIKKPWTPICLLAGGSTLYGMETETSDLDLRGVFLLNNLSQILGLDIYGSRSYENYVLRGDTDGVDCCLYDLRKFVHLLAKTNTQVMEIIWANPKNFLYLDPVFQTLIDFRRDLIDGPAFYNSLKGYIENERRLMNGERTGKLGSKRRAALEKFNYSYKNLIQILRLGWCGRTLFTEGYYPVNVKETDPDFWKFLMDIKTNPASISVEKANFFVNSALSLLTSAYSRGKVFKFDTELANNVLVSAYAKQVKSTTFNFY